MKSKILAKLKEKFSGLPNDYLETIAVLLAATVTEEEKIDDAITSASPMIDASFKWAQSDTDRRVTAAVKTNSDNLKKEVKEKHGIDLDTAPKRDDKTQSDDVPAWAKGLIEKVGTLSEKINQTETERNMATHREKLVSIFKEKQIPETYYRKAIDGRSFKDDTELNSFADGVVGDFEEMKKGFSSEGMIQMTPPANGSKDKDGVQTAVKEFTQNITAESKTSPIGGKAL